MVFPYTNIWERYDVEQQQIIEERISCVDAFFNVLFRLTIKMKTLFLITTLDQGGIETLSTKIFGILSRT